MSMHMIRGVQVHGRSKVKRKAGWKKAQDEHEAFLKKMGVTGKKSTWRSEIPEYKCKETVPTSDVICSNDLRKRHRNILVTSSRVLLQCTRAMQYQ